MTRKTANEKLNGSKDLPKLLDLSTKPEAMKRLRGKIMLVASPKQYELIMGSVPPRKVITLDHIRLYLAKQAHADLTCPITSGMFTNICANASDERIDNKIAWWRTLKKAGELNEKYPGGIDAQKLLLEIEGHKVEQRRKRYFVVNYEDSLFHLE